MQLFDDERDSDTKIHCCMLLMFMTGMSALLTLFSALIALVEGGNGRALVSMLATTAGGLFILWWLLLRKPPTGNKAFEDYEVEAINKLIKRRADFIKYTKQCYDEEDKAVFKQFMESIK